MGLKGPRARDPYRQPAKNDRPNAASRAKRVEAGSAEYWNLVLGEPEVERWADDPYCESREQAWRQWETRIFARWRKSAGWRPAAWLDFTGMERLAAAVADGRFTEEAAIAMSDVELAYHLDADAAERALIEELWRAKIHHAAWMNPDLNPMALREHTVISWDVPRWFFDTDVTCLHSQMARSRAS